MRTSQGNMPKGPKPHFGKVRVIALHPSARGYQVAQPVQVIQKRERNPVKDDRCSAGGPSKLGWPSGENPEMARKAVLSEGRTLCVRVVWPNECQGISFPPHALKIALGPPGHTPRSSPCLPCGRAEPAPLYLMHEYQVPWLCEYHVHVGVPSTPRTSTPVPPYPCPVRTPQREG